MAAGVVDSVDAVAAVVAVVDSTADAEWEWAVAAAAAMVVMVVTGEEWVPNQPEAKQVGTYLCFQFSYTEFGD